MDVSTAKRLFFLGLIGSLVTTAAIAIGVLLFGDFNDTTSRILLTTALLALASLLALPAGVLLDQGRYGWFAWATILLVLGGFVVAMMLVWRDWENQGGEPLWKALAVWATFAGAASQAAATTSRRRAGDTSAVRTLYLVAIGLSLAVAAMVSSAVAKEIDDETFYRALGALVVADLLFVILQSVARRYASVPAAAGDVETIRVSGPAVAIDDAVRELERRGLRVERRG
jgi:hypothetical protein